MNSPHEIQGLRKTSRLRVLAILLASSALIAACGGSSSSSDGVRNAVVVEATPVASGLEPQANGFAFPNFGAGATPEELNGNDLVTMFGASDTVCKDGVVPCVPTSEAAVWARMANQARQSGHCEGFAVVSAARYMEAASPRSIELVNSGDVTHDLIRGFATQFFPEVQEATSRWQKASLKEKVNELVASLGTKKLEYTLGVYIEDGGHAVLPYAVDFPSADVAKISVYDSNWPGQQRFVLIDLKENTWSFSFSGTDPENDDKAWTGKSPDLDITPLTARLDAKCPFCGDNTGVNKTLLVLRSSAPDWTIDTGGENLSPTNRDVGESSTRPLKLAEDGSVSDYLVVLDSSKPATFTLPSATHVTGITPNAAVEFETPGSESGQVEITADVISSNDPVIELTMAAGDLAASGNGAETSLTTSGEGDSSSIQVNVVTLEGDNIDVVVNNNIPAVAVVTEGSPKLAEGEKYVVVTQTGENEVTTKTVTTTGQETIEVAPGDLGFSEVTQTLQPELVANEVSAELPPAEERVFVEEDRTRNSVLETTTTVAETTTTEAPTTTAAPATTAKKVTTTTKVPSTTTTSTTTTVAPTTTTSTTTTTSSTTTTTTTIPSATPLILGATVSAGGSSATRDMTTDDSGNSYLLDTFCGSTYTLGGVTVAGAGLSNHCNIVVAKITPGGSVAWIQTLLGSATQNWGESIAVDGTGNVFITGFFDGATLTSGTFVLTQQSITNNDTFIIKLNSSGAIQWGKVLGGGTTQYLRADYAVDLTVSGDNVYVVGLIYGGGTVTFDGLSVTPVSSNDVYVAKLNSSSGNAEWLRSYPTSTMYVKNNAVADDLGNIFIAATFDTANITFGLLTPISNANAGTNDIFVVKINSSGTPQWAVAQGGVGNESVAAISATSSGVAIAGSFASASFTSGSTTLTRLGSSSAFVSRISSSGAIVGASFIAGSFNLGSASGNMVEDSSGNLYLSGTFTGTATVGSTTLQTAGADYDAYLIKISSMGSVQWALRLGNAANLGGAFVGLNVGGVGLYFDNGQQLSLTIGSQTSSSETSFFVRIGRDGQLP
jgi:hypothetical protein